MAKYIASIPIEAFKNSKLAISMNEAMLAHESKPDKYYGYDYAFESAAAIVEAVGENSDNLGYLQRIFSERKMPRAAILDLDTWEDPDDYAQANYYKYVVNALAKIKSPEAVHTIEQMLLSIDQQNEEFIRETRHIATDSDKIAMAESKLLIPGHSHRYLYTEDTEEERKRIAQMEPAQGSDDPIYRDFFGEELDSLDPNTKKLILGMNSRLLKQAVILKREGKYGGVPPEEIIRILQEGFINAGTFDPFEAYEQGGSWGAFYSFNATAVAARFKEHAITVLGEVGSDQTIEVFKRFIVSQGDLSPVWFDRLLSAFRDIDLNKSAAMLLELARSGNEINKMSALAMLYRLEPRQIGISEEGVHYLQRVFDVGQFNNPNFYAQRITSRGQVGIFEKSSQRLQKYFELTGLTSEEKNTAQLMDLTYATLFTPKKGETEGERHEREKFLAEFQEKYFGFLNGDFFDIAGIRFNDLSFAEQAQFMMFYGRADEAMKTRVIDFCKKFGLNGFKVFLSLDYGKEMADVVLQIGDSHPAASKIFAKYVEIINKTEVVEDYLATNVKGLSDRPQVIDRVRENLLRRAKEFIAQYKITGDGADSRFDLKRVTRELDNLKSGVLLYGATLKGLREEGQKIDMEDLAGAEFIVVEGVQPEDVPQMRAIYARNYAHVPEFQRELLENFDRVMSPDQGYGWGDGGNTYYILKINGQVRAFNRFHTLGEDDREGITHVEFGFFNVDRDYQGFEIGEAMMERSLDLQARSAIIEATCTATDVIAQRYIARGFVGTGFVADYKGIADLSIERDDQENLNYKSKFISKDEIISKLGFMFEQNFEIDGVEIKIASADQKKDLPFSLANEGWILTQYFSREKKYFGVFEKVEPEGA
ncbi:MAG: hypothetical protein HY336_02045 [Candidatus Doudnabacteria bacterium]|nr:hypothetical protein [Candidatus Doudnabacteria bacterium]